MQTRICAFTYYKNLSHDTQNISFCFAIKNAQLSEKTKQKQKTKLNVSL